MFNLFITLISLYRVESRIATAIEKNPRLLRLGIDFQFPESRNRYRVTSYTWMCVYTVKSNLSSVGYYTVAYTLYNLSKSVNFPTVILHSGIASLELRTRLVCIAGSILPDLP